jgi:chromate transporter
MTENPQPDPLEKPIGYFTLAKAFLLTGLTAFGFTALQVLRSTVKKRGWLSDEKLDEGIALVQLYPGPVNFDYTAYLGYQIRRIPGAIISTMGFVFPSFLLMLGMSALYFSTGNIPWVPRLFIGLEAIVVGIILNLVIDLGKKALISPVAWVIAIAALPAIYFKIDSLWIVLASLTLGVLFLRPKPGNSSLLERPQEDLPTSRGEWIQIGVVILIILAFLIYSTTLAPPLNILCLSFFKVGSIAFGNGMMILPVLRAEVVDKLQLLTPTQFTDGVVLGQVTPGPFLITATFIGYKVAGVFGAVMATFAIFSPTFAMTLVFTKIYNRVRNSTAIKGALAGVLAAFVGMLVMITYQMAQVGIRDILTALFALAAFCAVRFLKLEIVWVFLIGLALWAGCLFFGLA